MLKQLKKITGKPAVKGLAAAALAASLGACTTMNGGGYAPAPVSSVQGTYTGPYGAPRSASYGQHNPSPNAGQVIDRWPNRIEGCDRSSGLVYQFRLVKVINMNDQVDVVRVPESYKTGFRSRVNPISCNLIEGLAEAQERTYAARPNTYYNRLPRINN